MEGVLPVLILAFQATKTAAAVVVDAVMVDATMVDVVTENLKKELNMNNTKRRQCRRLGCAFIRTTTAS